jgi:hypothetical protein
MNPEFTSPSLWNPKKNLYVQHDASKIKFYQQETSNATASDKRNASTRNIKCSNTTFI